MAKQNSKGAWIAGAILGSIAGAAYALWKTPMSGQELRSKLTTGPVNQNDDVVSAQPYTQGVGDKLLSKLEHTLAPIVGVELGKTADEPAPVYESAPAAAETVAEPVVAAQETTRGDTDSIRAPRFAWGDPAPDNTVAPDTREDEAVIPEAAPVVQAIVDAAIGAEETEAAYGTESIRAKRYGWGDPAPESATNGHTDTAEQATAPIGVATAHEPVAAVSGSNKRQFPKLGGLES